jgi:hypothetical protein
MAIELLKKPTGQRNKSDIHFLVHTFKEITFFHNLYKETGVETMKSLCRALQHRSGYEKTMVFQAGTPACAIF